MIRFEAYQQRHKAAQTFLLIGPMVRVLGVAVSVAADYTPSATPARVVSAYDHFRYRLRLTGYALTFLRKPTSYEIVGLALGLLGAGAFFGTVSGFVIALPLIARIGVATALTISLLAIVSLYVARIPRIMAMAARDPDSTDRLREHMREGLGNDHAFRALEHVYLPQLAEINEALRNLAVPRKFHYVTNSSGDCPFLAIVLPAAPDETLEELLNPRWVPRSREWQLRASRFADARQQYMHKLHEAMGRPSPAGDYEVGDNLVLERIGVDASSGHLRLDASIATYGQIMRTSDALINEFALFAYVGRERVGELGPAGTLLARLGPLRVGRAVDLTPRATMKQLPWRREVHHWAPSWKDLFLEPTSRAAGLGVAVTMIKKDAHKPTAYTGRRSATVGTYADVRHVAPAGMCNTKEDIRADGAPIRADFLKWTMLGELLEECYDERELAVYRTADWVRRIKEMCEAHEVSTESPTFTGLAFDLLNLRPEICAVVEVVDPGARVPPEHFKLCWEYSPLTGLNLLDISAAPDGCMRTDWVQSGVASLALAREHYTVTRSLGTSKGS